MTASWLKQMGWKDVFVLPEAGDEKGEAGACRCSATPSDKPRFDAVDARSRPTTSP